MNLGPTINNHSTPKCFQIWAHRAVHKERYHVDIELTECWRALILWLSTWRQWFLLLSRNVHGQQYLLLQLRVEWLRCAIAAGHFRYGSGMRSISTHFLPNVDVKWGPPRPLHYIWRFGPHFQPLFWPTSVLLLRGLWFMLFVLY